MRAIWEKYRWIFIVMFIVILALFVATSVGAYEDDDGEIGPDEVINDDAFVSAEVVNVDGTINGNLFASGSLVTIDGVVDGNLFVGSDYAELSGKVSGDAFLTGRVVVVSEEAEIDGDLVCGAQTIDVRGSIGRSIYCGGFTLTLDNTADIGDSLFFGGYSLETRPESNVERDLFAGLYQARLGGGIGRNLTLDGAAVELVGNVGRNVMLNIEEVSEDQTDMGPIFSMWFQMEAPPRIDPGLHVAETADIGGKLTYTSPVQLGAGIESEPEGGVAFQTPVPEAEPEGAQSAVEERPWGQKFLMAVLRRILKGMRSFITLIILGGLALWLLPSVSQGVVNQARREWLTSAVYGFVTLIIGYIGSLLVVLVILVIGFFFLMLTLGGLALSVFGIGFTTLTLVMVIFTMLVIWGSKLVTAYMIGEMIINRFVTSTSFRRVMALVLGVVIYVVIWMIPVLGFMAAVVATLIGLGAMWLYFEAGRKPDVVKAIVDPPEKA